MAPRKCAICDSPRRRRLEAEVAGGLTIKAATRALGMPYESAKRHFREHVQKWAAVAPDPEPGEVPTDPLETFRLATGDEAMPHQVALLREKRNTVTLKGRQTGCSTAAAVLMIHIARLRPGSLSALLAPSLRQAAYVASRARMGLLALGEELVQDSQTTIRLRNGSVVAALPGASDTAVRGWSVDGVLCLDEAQWLKKEVWQAARATVAATGGRILVQSTLGDPDTWFHDLAENTPEGWARLVVPSSEAATIAPEFLARERAELDPVTYGMEYDCRWPDPLEAARGLFTQEQIDAMKTDEEPYAPLRALDETGGLR